MKNKLIKSMAIVTASLLCNLNPSLAFAKPQPSSSPMLLPPKVVFSALVSDNPVQPYGPVKVISTCATPSPLPADSQSVSNPQSILQFQNAWTYGKGAGQKVAIIGTGVSNDPRLPGLIPGGDYVNTRESLRPGYISATDRPPVLNGTFDCDSQGTALAGIIAAQPSQNDSFVGVAPEARIITIRQFSQTVALDKPDTYIPNWEGLKPDKNYGPSITLAQSIVRAVKLGATIILIPNPECFPAQEPTSMLRENPIGAAVKYAYDHNILVISSSGEYSSNATVCKTQNDIDYKDSLAAENAGPVSWQGLNVLVSPSIFHKYVLTVADSDKTGLADQNSIYGPWVDISAPGNNVISLSSNGTGSLSNGLEVLNKDGSNTSVPYDGSAFSAAYVAGVAALVRSHYPDENPEQIMQRLLFTAHHPGVATGRDNSVGYGLVDPVGALTQIIPENAGIKDDSKPGVLTDNVKHASFSRLLPIGIILGLLLIGAIAIAISFPLRKINESRKTSKKN